MGEFLLENFTLGLQSGKGPHAVRRGANLHMLTVLTATEDLTWNKHQDGQVFGGLSKLSS